MRNRLPSLHALILAGATLLAAVAGTARAQDSESAPPELPPGLEQLGNIGSITQIIGGITGIDMSGAGFDKMILLDQAAVQQELNMSDKQVAQVKEKMANLGPGSLQDSSDPLKALQSLANMGKSIDNMLVTVLRPPQIKRLKEISLQQRGSQAFADPAVQSQLNLTTAQRQQITSILGESTANLQGMFQKAMAEGAMQTNATTNSVAGGNSFKIDINAKPTAGAAATPKTDAERLEEVQNFANMFTGTEDRLMAVLTKSQVEKWQKMRGAPFKFNLIEQAMRDGRLATPAADSPAPDSPAPADEHPADLQPATDH